jgi:hypothetical protein
VWFALVSLVLIGGIRFYSESPGYASVPPKDATFFIDAQPLPPGWSATWAGNESSFVRLTISCARKDLAFTVLAFRGNLDESKFEHIEKLVYSHFPPPEQTLEVRDYGDIPVRRSYYFTKSDSGAAAYTQIDLVWSEAREKYAYVIVASSSQALNPDVMHARSSLRFYPPRLTVFGRIRQGIGYLSELLENGETLFALLTWLVAAVIGVGYATSRLDRIWRPAKYLVWTAVVASGAAARALFNLNWAYVLLIPIALLVIIGIAVALISRKVSFED